MIKKLSLLALLFTIPYSAISQYKIILNKTNLFNYHQSYLIDIPLKKNMQNLFLVDNKGLLISYSLHQQFTTLLGQNVDTIIVSQKARSYAMIWGYNTFVKVDSAKALKNKTNNYTELRQIDTKHQKDSILIYYSEIYGSSCCPRDPKWDLKTSLKNFTDNFEKSHNTKVGKVYEKSYGDEGEHECYYTLSGLTGKQKVEFISKRLNDLLPDIVTKKTIVLLTPYWMLDPDRDKVN